MPQPHSPPRTAMKTIVLLSMIALAGAAPTSPAAAQGEGAYAADLSRIYEAAQFVRAVKESCDTLHRKSAPANATAYNAWRRRNQPLLDELERRFTALIRGASTDEKDYAKNIGKYGGAVLQHREEMKEQFRAQPPQEAERQCREFPQYLKSEDADLATRYAEELRAIRKRKL